MHCIFISFLSFLTLLGHEATASPELLNAAVDYVNIRAFSMPTSLLLGVVQAACLGAKDSVTPLIAILYLTIVNVIGDYLLVTYFPMGLRGAAIATTLAQWAATAALLGPAQRRLLRNHSLQLFQRKKNSSQQLSSSLLSDDHVNGKSFLSFAALVLLENWQRLDL